jgi:hypothetical protein
MSLKIKLGMIVRSTEGAHFEYKVINRANMIISNETLESLKITPSGIRDIAKLRLITKWVCYVMIRNNEMYFCPEHEFCDGRFVEAPKVPAQP